MLPGLPHFLLPSHFLVSLWMQMERKRRGGGLGMRLLITSRYQLIYSPATQGNSTLTIEVPVAVKGHQPTWCWVHWHSCLLQCLIIESTWLLTASHYCITIWAMSYLEVSIIQNWLYKLFTSRILGRIVTVVTTFSGRLVKFIQVPTPTEILSNTYCIIHRISMRGYTNPIQIQLVCCSYGWWQT